MHCFKTVLFSFVSLKIVWVPKFNWLNLCNFTSVSLNAVCHSYFCNWWHLFNNLLRNYRACPLGITLLITPKPSISIWYYNSTFFLDQKTTFAFCEFTWAPSYLPAALFIKKQHQVLRSSVPIELTFFIIFKLAPQTNQPPKWVASTAQLFTNLPADWAKLNIFQKSSARVDG